MSFFSSRILVLACVCCLWATPGRAYTNLWEYEQDLIKYHDTKYLQDIRTVTRQARIYVLQRAAKGGKLAMVLDIDETALSDWKEITGVMNFGYNDDLFKAWAKLEEAQAISPTVDLFRQAQAAGVKIFFVSGRPEELRQATEDNLHKAGYDGWTRLDLKPPDYQPPPGLLSKIAAFKLMCREAIEAQGYVIIANVGDQPSDLAGGHAEKTFKIPNPFYHIP